MADEHDEGSSRRSQSVDVTDAFPPDPSRATAASERGDRRSRRPIAALIVLAVLVTVGVVAVALSRSSTPVAQGGADPAASPAAATPVPSPVSEPRSVKAKASTSAVVLTWKPGGADGDDTIRIRRDGAFLAEEPVGAGRYVDDNVMPGTSYTYLLQIVRATDDRASQHVEVIAETQTPPVTAARLADVFDVRFEIQSSSGFSGLDERFTGAWRFRPGCKTGACDVVLSDPHGGGVEGVKLARTRGTYRGSGSGRIGYSCGSTPTTSSFTVEARVVKAEVLNGVWRATRIEGTFRVSNAQQLGCRSGSITMTLTATLVPRN